MDWRFSGLAILVLLCASAMAEADGPTKSQGEAVIIPLDEIWATNMPGTRDLEKIDAREPLAYEILRSLGFPPKDKKAKPAFAVMGEGLAALRQAHETFARGRKARYVFPAGSEISIVFFANETRQYVHIQGVERESTSIKIRYRFVPHETEDTARYLSLIPLGKLAVGEYRVDIVCSPMEQTSVDIGFRPMSDEIARRIVSQPFSFSITEQGE